MQSPSAQAASRFHGERVEARQAERNPDIFNDLDRSHRASRGDRVVADLLATLVIGAAIDEALGGGRRTPRFAGMDGILSAIDQAPDSPFMNFWQKLNNEYDAQGADELLYREAKLAYAGGKTPDGTLTFVGRDDIRAVPVTGTHSYFGEFKQLGEYGNTVWRVVADRRETPIAYGTAEAALNGASAGQKHSQS